MGTRGLIAIRYKGCYYIRYNHMDSYPDGLGQDLVDCIPISEEQFAKWLENKQKLCQMLSVVKGDYEKSTSPPQNDLFIEWTYTYDLDNLLFLVDNKAPFNLRNIAQKPGTEWIPFISIDARGYRCLSLDAPPELVGQFVSTTEPFLGGDTVPAVQDFVPTSAISPATWLKPLSLHHRRLMLVQVNAIIAETYSDLFTFPLRDLSEVDAQDFAMSFLEAIVPNNQSLVVYRQPPTLNIRKSADSKPENRGPWFWYRGCLILLASKLDDNERFRLYVQAVASRTKAKNRDRCTVLLWSIHHVAVVEISGGSVSHSDPIPLLAAYGSDEEGFMNALHLLWHYLIYPRWRIVEEGNVTSRPVAVRISEFGNLPTEIQMRIMMFIDQLHYPNYQFLSHSFFKLWWKHLRVGFYTILPDAEEVSETSRRFTAYSPDADAAVELQLKVSWGKKTGSIWRSDEMEIASGNADAVSFRLRDPEVAAKFDNKSDDEKEFSQGSSCYRLRRFSAHWVEDHFSGQSNVLSCKVLPI